MTRAALVALAIAAAARAAAAQPDQAQARADEAARAFEAGDYDAALAGFRAAYELDPVRDYVYAMALIEEKRGRCPEAIVLYREFLATDPPAEDVAAAREAIERCGGTVEPEPEPEPEPTPPPPEPEPVPTITRRIERPFYHDVLGDSLVAAGVVGLAAGGVLYLRAGARRDDAEEPGISSDEFEARWGEARDLRRWAVIAAVAGAGLAAGGALRWATADHVDTVTVAADGDAVALVAAGRF